VIVLPEVLPSLVVFFDSPVLMIPFVESSSRQRFLRPPPGRGVFEAATTAFGKASSRFGGFQPR
jgi:hypothetical protein